MNILNTVDGEYEQSVIRLILGSMVITYLLIFTQYQSWMAPSFSCFLLISLVLSCSIKKIPGQYWWRRIFGQLIDFGAISINIYMCGESALPVLGVYLWVIIGNGFRFGLPYLLSAIMISTIMFAFVALNEPFLASHKYVALGIAITQIIVPFYFAILLRRFTKTTKRLEFLSEFDDLTGLLNRRKFDTLIRSEFERLKRRPAEFSLAIIDIDHFKKVNDELGHLTGDKVLTDVAKTLKTHCRQIDILARYGGEEFAVLLPGANIGDSVVLGDRLRRSVSDMSLSFDMDNLSVTVSVGIASWQKKYKRVEDWIKVADEALYDAKKDGRNKVIVTSNNDQLKKIRSSN